ncbi:hypothetical protein BDZ91DRAFT_564676 [Kalaharituber pfeilii]|nr:hypothetical protein BDZ91DRAFT_564676 [Kalaharituber pfeilii]
MLPLAIFSTLVLLSSCLESPKTGRDIALAHQVSDAGMNADAQCSNCDESQLLPPSSSSTGLSSGFFFFFPSLYYQVLVYRLGNYDEIIYKESKLAK